MMQAHVVSLKLPPPPPAQWLQWEGAHFRLGIGAHFKLSKIGPMACISLFFRWEDTNVRHSGKDGRRVIGGLWPKQY